MNRILLALTLGLLLHIGNIDAQKILCGYDLAVQSMEDKYPGYKEAVQKTFEAAKQRGQASRLNRNDETYTIPVVVHVVWKEEEQNIHDSLIYSQIDVLNEDFQRLNADAGNIRPIFEDVVGSPNIEFKLLAIERVETSELFEASLTGLPDNVKVTSQGGSDAYDTETHLNIWVCMLQPLSIGGISLGQILGYAYPPAGLPNWPTDQPIAAPSPELDGVVIDYRVFGRVSPFEVDPGLGTPLQTQGRTPTHEVGHYLGLRHIWGDGGGLFGGDSCGEDDGVEDTPNAGTQSNFDCDINKNTCTDAVDDKPDMIENFMDYAAEDCMNSFTQGQIDIMRGVLENERNGLLMNPASTSTIDLSNEFSIAPNPTSGILSFETSIYDVEKYSVEVFNLTGQKVPFSIDFTSKNINLEGLPSGLYILNLQKDKMQVVKKISVVR